MAHVPKRSGPTTNVLATVARTLSPVGSWPAREHKAPQQSRPLKRVIAGMILLAVSWHTAFTRPAFAQFPALPWFPATEAEYLNPELETDRDAFTPATSTVGRSRTVVESSYSFIDNRIAHDTNSFPELLVRTGVFENLELRYGWNYEAGGGGNIVSSDEGAEGGNGLALARESRMLYGFKAQTSEQAGWIPRSCAIVEGFTPTGGETTASQLVATYALGWELENRWRLEGALRYATGKEGFDSFNRWGPSAILRVPVTIRWDVHAEYFGVFTQGLVDDSSRSFFSPGTHFLVTPNLELGFRCGWGVNVQAARFFSNVGFAYRF